MADRDRDVISRSELNKTLHRFSSDIQAKLNRVQAPGGDLRARYTDWPMKGSPTRPAFSENGGFRSVVVLGANAAATSMSDGATGTFTIPISEDCVLDRLAISCNAAVALVAGAENTNVGLLVTSIKVNNDELLGSSGGFCPASVFDARSQVSPVFGHRVKVSDNVTVTLSNQTGATVEAAVGFTVR